jgi:tRNA-dihydrouridine synthase B
MPGNFWEKLKKPIFVLAPMADVTDAAFRTLIAKYGKPPVMWTEFVSADGLIRATEIGKKKLLRDLLYSEEERPIVAQLFGAHPEYMKEAAKLVYELGFDGFDLNMGCPDRSVEKQGAGAAMMKNPKLAREIIRAAKEGIKEAAEKAGKDVIPVSVKIRLGYNKDELETWLPEVLAEEPAVVTVHARTRKEMSDVPAHWDRVKRAVEIRDSLKSKTLIFGNGDVKNLNEARQRVEETGADGVMLGRAIFGNPWLFTDSENVSKIPSTEEKLKVMLEHTKLFEKLLGDIKNFAIMKKHYKAYVKDFDGAHELRAKLMETKNADEVEQLVNQFLKNIFDENKIIA